MKHDAFLSSADIARTLLDHDELADRWNDPSPLASMSLGDLTAHLCRAVTVVDTYLDTTGSAEPVDAPGYFLAVDGIRAPDLDGPTARGVRSRAAATSAGGLDAVRCSWDSARRSLEVRLGAEGGQRRIEVFGSTMETDEYLTTRLVELIVHSDDLAVGLGVPTPDFTKEALDGVVECLFTMARRQSRPISLIRAMTRVEREGRDPFRVF